MIYRMRDIDYESKMKNVSQFYIVQRSNALLCVSLDDEIDTLFRLYRRIHTMLRRRDISVHVMTRFSTMSR